MGIKKQFLNQINVLNKDRDNIVTVLNERLNELTNELNFERARVDTSLLEIKERDKLNSE